LVDLVQFTPTGEVDWKTVVPLIDGGTEAFSGQVRLSSSPFIAAAAVVSE
jgi:hypothetical protein